MTNRSGPQESSGAFLSIERVTKNYSSVQVLKGISLEVRQGEYVALLGPSGCGKTTLLRSIAGLVSLSGGEIYLEQKPLTNLPPNRRPVNTVFQNYALFPHYNVAKNIAFGPQRAGLSSTKVREAVREALAIVGMEAYSMRYPSELSGGQQQRIALARAIVNKPKILLLDEPLGALDLKLRKQMQVELKRLHRRLGMTFIHVTHDQEEALVLADRVAVMNAGEIVQYDTGQAVYRNPNSTFIADFIGDANIVEVTCMPEGVSIAGQAVAITSAVPLKPGTSYKGVLRPEEIFLSSDGIEGKVNALSCTVVESIFSGSSTQLLLDLGDDATLRCNCLHTGVLPAVGQRVNVHFSAAALRLMEE